MARFSKEQKAVLDQLMYKQICEAAIRVIVDYGIEQMTMDKVAENAGVAKGTLYNYFKIRMLCLPVLRIWFLNHSRKILA